MKKILSLSLMFGGLTGSVFAGTTVASNKTDNNTPATSKMLAREKNQKVAWLPRPIPGSGQSPC